MKQQFYTDNTFGTLLLGMTSKTIDLTVIAIYKDQTYSRIYKILSIEAENTANVLITLEPALNTHLQSFTMFNIVATDCMT